MEIQSFCVLKLYYQGNYPGVAVISHVKKLYNSDYGGKLKYCGILP